MHRVGARKCASVSLCVCVGVRARVCSLCVRAWECACRYHAREHACTHATGSVWLRAPRPVSPSRAAMGHAPFHGWSDLPKMLPKKCECVCVRVCLRGRAQMCGRACAQRHTVLHTHTRARARKRTHARMHARTHTHTLARAHTQTHKHTHARAHTRKEPNEEQRAQGGGGAQAREVGQRGERRGQRPANDVEGQVSAKPAAARVPVFGLVCVRMRACEPVCAYACVSATLFCTHSRACAHARTRARSDARTLRRTHAHAHTRTRARAHARTLALGKRKGNGRSAESRKKATTGRQRPRARGAQGSEAAHRGERRGQRPANGVGTQVPAEPGAAARSAACAHGRAGGGGYGGYETKACVRARRHLH